MTGPHPGEGASGVRRPEAVRKAERIERDREVEAMRRDDPPTPLGNLVLAGFMGVGKSATARRVAAMTGLTFYDLDGIVEARAGVSVPEIFAAEGETGFRRREAEAVGQVVSRQGFVLAVGGGTLLNEASFEALNAAGLLVCLTARPETIVQRLRHDDSRPLLRGPDRVERLRRLMRERRGVYARIFRRVATDRRSVEEVAGEVVRLWREWMKTRRVSCRKS